MGFGMSRLEDESIEYYEGFNADQSSSSPAVREMFRLENEIFHITRLRSGPSGCALRARGNNMNTISAYKLLRGREANCTGKGKFSLADQSCLLGQCLPTKGPIPVDRTDSRAYISQFSADGSLLVAGFQASQIRLYSVDRGWKIYKDIHARSLRWTITDASLSPDQRFLVYSSMSPMVHIVNVGIGGTESYANITDVHDGLDFSQHADVIYSFGVFTVKFSSDGREIVGGSNDDCIYVYDLHANKLTLRLPAHTSDVNTVVFGDESGHLMYSGSDDNLCKVWDRRCLTHGRAVGTLTGHMQGVTHIDSRGDGRYFISNGKDQTIKMWDIRTMSSNENWDQQEESYPTRLYNWDYRFSRYPPEYTHIRHQCDKSLATYRGHTVLRTLVRCYFSPAFSTGQRYIYTGSHDASVYIYDVVSGELVVRLSDHELAVRDCSWHPQFPTLVSSSWDCRINRWEYSP